MSTSTATLVTHASVVPDCADKFVRWQQQMSDTIATFPGYLDHTIIPPSPPLQTDWVLIQRFQSVEAARAWLQSEQQQHLLDALQPFLGSQSDIHLFTQDAPDGSPSSVSVIISTRVKPGQQDAFLHWYRRISALQARFEGFQGYKFEPPIPGVQEDWVTILRFDSDVHLEAWLNSEQRQQILQEADAFSLDTHLRKVRVGFDSWLKFTNDQQSSPPTWKVNMLVLLALYPTVFLFSILVQTPFLIRQGMPFWLALFFSNAVSTALLSWVFVPPLSTLFGWWLNPPEHTTPPAQVPYWRSTGAGVVLILCLYATFLFVFSRLS